MKQFTILLFALLYLSASAQSSSQSKVNTKAKNEIRLNLLMTAIGFPELSYDRFFANNTSVGFSALAFIRTDKAAPHIYSLTPYYRIYFGQKKTSNFFFEGYVMATLEKDIYSYPSNGYYGGGSLTYYDRGYEKGYGYGVAVGEKIFTKSGIVGEICLGVGRLYRFDNSELFPRLGISIGKRF